MKWNRDFRLTVIMVLTLVLLPVMAQATIFYVDSSKTNDNGDGKSWLNAKKYLQSGLALAFSGDDVYVAKGTYYPDEGTGQSDNDRTSTFQMIEGVDMYGGYATGGGVRDVSTYLTILSGDLDQSGDKNNKDAYHVVTGANTATIDGFIITGGYANISGNTDGGGMYNNGVSTTINNCTFSYNTSYTAGGGMYNNNASPNVIGCTFSYNNTANGHAGGMYSGGTDADKPTIDNCIFSNNTASGHGGALHIANTGPNTTVTNCSFYKNSGDNGGALFSDGTDATYLKCSFISNFGYMGGAVRDYGGNSQYINCVFLNDTTTTFGGGLYATYSTTSLTNCTFYGNSAGGVDGFISYDNTMTVKNCISWGSDMQIGHGGTGSMTVTYSDIQQTSGVYTDTGNINSDPQFMSDSDLHLTELSPCISTGTSTGAPLDDIEGNTRPDPSGSNPDMGAYEEQLTYSDYEYVTNPGTYNFNETAEGGDDHDVDINFTSLTGSDSVNVRQILATPSDAPCVDVCGFYWNIAEGSGISAFTANLTFHYTNSDVSGYTESADYLGIGKFNASTNTWVWLGGTVDGGANAVTVFGVTSFSTFALFRRIFGDCTGDGYVDAADLQNLGDCWHETNTGEFGGGTNARFFNFNKNTDAGDQIIDAADLQVFGDCWHNGIP